MQNRIGPSELFLWIISLITLIAAITVGKCCPEIYQIKHELFTFIYSITTGVISALTIVALQRYDRNRHLKNLYKNQIGGKYTRTYIHEYQTNHQDNLQNTNIGALVTLSHLGDNIVRVETSYWKQNVIGILEFNEMSESLATGIYRYPDTKTPDVGTYKVHRFRENSTQLYVYYENTIPGNGARGYEIWTKEK